MSMDSKWGLFRKRRALCGAVWLALAVLLMVFSQSALTTAFPGGAVLSARYDGEGPAFSGIRRVREQAVDERGDPVAGIVAWREKKAQLRQESTGAEVEADAIWVDGPSEAVWDLKPLSGSLPVFGDENIAALSRDMAMKLFGSVDVLGQTIACEGKRFTVACVFELPGGASAPAADPGRGLAILPASALPIEEGEEAPTAQGFDCLFPADDPGDPDAAVENWFTKAGVTGPDRVENRARTKALVAFMASLPQGLMALLAALLLAGESVRQARAASVRLRMLREDRRVGPAGLFGALAIKPLQAMAFALSGLGILLLSGGARLPPALIPSRWSDLAFWPSLLNEFLADVAERALRGAARQDLVTQNLAALSCILAVFALPAIWFSYRAFRQGAHSSGGVLPEGMRWLIPVMFFYAPAATLLARCAGLTVGAPGANLWLIMLFPVVYALNFSHLGSALRTARQTLPPHRNIKQEVSS